MVEEFDFYRKVRSYYCNVPFSVVFTYRSSYRLVKKATANGSFSCSVNAHSQTVEYVMQLKTDPISRPYSERDSFLFTSVYEEIPEQTIEFDNYPIQKLRYRVPIAYDWQQFIRAGAENAINVKSIQQLFKKWKLKGMKGQPIEAYLKVLKVQMNW